MQPCRACQHRRLKTINQQLLDGLSLRTIGQQFDLTKDSLSRHWRSNHSSHDAPNVYWLDFADVSPDGELPSKASLTVRFWTGPKTARKVLARPSDTIVFFSPAPFPWVMISNSLYDARERAIYGKQLAFSCLQCKGEAQRLYFVNEATTPRKYRWLTCCENCLRIWRLSPNERQSAVLAAIATATETGNTWTKKRAEQPWGIKGIEAIPASATEIAAMAEVENTERLMTQADRQEPPTSALMEETPQARQERVIMGAVKKEPPENLANSDLASQADAYSETDADGTSDQSAAYWPPPPPPAPTLESILAEWKALRGETTPTPNAETIQPRKAGSPNGDWDWQTHL
jgi:hypothetical protein